MNINKDIFKHNIPHMCTQCVMRNNCKNPNRSKIFNPRCGRFTPDNINEYLSYLTNYFTCNLPKSRYKTLKRECGDTGAYTYNDKVDTLDYYYVNFINDTLSELRQNHTAYIFTLEQLMEVSRFVNVDARYVESSIALTLKSKK